MAYELKRARFWYNNYRGVVAYRTVDLAGVPFFNEEPQFGYTPGYFISGFDVDKPEGDSLRTFSLGPACMWFAEGGHWTNQGNVSPVANCAKVFGVDYTTALHFAHVRTHNHQLSPVGMDIATETMLPVNVEIRRLFYRHLQNIADTFKELSRNAA